MYVYVLCTDTEFQKTTFRQSVGRNWIANMNDFKTKLSLNTFTIWTTETLNKCNFAGGATSSLTETWQRRLLAGFEIAFGSHSIAFHCSSIKVVTECLGRSKHFSFWWTTYHIWQLQLTRRKVWYQTFTGWPGVYTAQSSPACRKTWKIFWNFLLFCLSERLHLAWETGLGEEERCAWSRD